jgi:hypothetical protein
VFTTYLTRDFHPSYWTDQEVGVALARAVLVLPIRRGSTPYGFMGKYQALDGRNKDARDLASEIDSILVRHRLTKDRLKSAKAAVKASVAERQETAASPSVTGLSLNKLKRLNDAGLTRLFEDQRKLWTAMAKDAYGYARKYEGPDVRPVDLVPTLTPALEVSDRLRTFLAEQDLSQHYWYTWFAELIVDRLWTELRWESARAGKMWRADCLARNVET